MKKKANDELRIVGMPISPGVACAPVCLFNDNRHRDIAMEKVPGYQAERESARLRAAVAVVGARLEEIRIKVARELGPAEAEIFTAQRMILEDPSAQRKVTEAIEVDTVTAETAVTRIFDAYETRMRNLDNEVLKERASDVGEIKRRLLDALGNTSPALRCAGESHCRRGRMRVVTARELTPALTVDLDTEHVMGFVTEHGGATSHAAILARALGIPAVSGLANIQNVLSCGTEILVDGNKGEVIVWPSRATLAQYPSLHPSAIRSAPAVPPIPGFRVMANISRAEEVRDAQRMEADGIGLYRTEFEFIAAGRMLEEDEQAERYSHVIREMAGHPVYIRLLDLGGDKTGAFLQIPAEDNPALGLRGARLLLSRPDLIEKQARAIARASQAGPVNVIYPMIVDKEQFLRLRQVFDGALRGMRAEGLRHGVMFEVPSACLQAREILEVADFGCIGTNDLFQYLFAVDRNNELVSQDAASDKSVFWTLIAGLVRTAADAGKPLSVCGEMAAHTQYVGRLIESGIRSVSVSTRVIPAVRHAARAHPRAGELT